jgi:flagellar basal body L-ring protein FlgH
VSSDNIVLSTQVADCRLEWSGRGAISEKQRSGLLSTALSWLW